MVVSREQIAAAALRHLNQSPTASMEEIARAAGVSRATLHRHFATRDELVSALGWRAMEYWERAQKQAGVAEAIESGDPRTLEAALHALVIGQAEIADEHGFTLTANSLLDDAALMRRIDELEELELKLFAACQRAGILRADLPVRWISNTLYGLLVAAVESLRRGDVARRDLSRLLLETFLRGTA
ncbi:TetR/AcrR family transcriptional regulator [Thermoactinospora rubra]|uniref:TetR/AcrR family transcriptional regulator n=1 Tax=Thermoactinospora rubra TaxID=1088767 RepID=UPI000A11E9A2|nr:TetR/AcrR family transcriptional regulator [Thermoactinospora rubra]